MTRGWFAVGIYRPKFEANTGTLLRAAWLHDAAFVFTIGARYRTHPADTVKTPAQIPLLHLADMDGLRDVLYEPTPIVGIELDDRAVPLQSFRHPRAAVYLLGAEDAGLPADVLAACNELVQIPTPQPHSMNVAAAGSIVMNDRYAKSLSRRVVSA